MKTTTILKTLAFTFLSLTSTSQAELITWSTPTEAVNEEDIDTTGTLVHAGYWGDDNGTLSITNTTETISFDYRGNEGNQDGSDSGSLAFMNTGFALDLNNPPNTDFFISTGTVGDADFDTMMSGSAVDGVGQTLLLSGLTIGNSYQVQLFASDDRPVTGARTQRYGDGLGNFSDTFAQNTSSYVIGTFTADASGTQSILIEGVSNPGRQLLSGYVLRATAVPEPSSAALLGLGALTLALRRRRA
jgi:hypothetical protein